MGSNNNTIDKFGRRKGVDDGGVQRGAPGIGFKLSSNGEFDMVGKRLINVAKPVNSNDATTKIFLTEEIRKLRVEMAETINNTSKAFYKSMGSLDDKMEEFKIATRRYDTQNESIEKKIIDLEERITGNMTKLLIVGREVNSIIGNSKMRI